MATRNQTIMMKADMEVADLINDGGYLAAEELKTFMVKLIQESVVLRWISAGPIRSHTQKLYKVGLSGRVLRPGTSGVALGAADRVKPETETVELQTRYMKGELRLDDETLEDNIENGRFQSKVRQMMAEQTSMDMDELAVNGDTASADAFLALQDGMLVKAVSHTVNAGNNPLTKGHLLDALKTMPKQYNRQKARHEFWTSELAHMDFNDYVSDRATPLGDDAFRREVPLFYQNRPLRAVPVFPDDLDAGHNTNVLLLDPSLAKWGVWRQVRLETERSAREGVYYIVVTVRAGFEYVEEDAVVKITNVQTTTP